MSKHCPHKKKGSCLDCYDKQFDEELEAFEDTTKAGESNER